MRYYRAYWLGPRGVLESPMKHHRLSFTDRVHTARCDRGHTPPDPACTCGLYVVTEAGWRRLCLGSRGPRVLAEVQPTGPVADVDGRCPRFWRSHSLRVGSLRLLALWLPGDRHCRYCQADPDQPHQASDETLAALAGRYQVPVERLP